MRLRRSFSETRYTTPNFGPSISGVGNYRLNALPHPVLAPELRNWSGDYSGLINDCDLVATTLQEKMLEYVEAGRTTDTHSWPNDIEPLNFPFTIRVLRDTSDSFYFSEGTIVQDLR